MDTTISAHSLYTITASPLSENASVDYYVGIDNDTAMAGLEENEDQSIQSRISRFLTQPHQMLAVLLSAVAILLNVLSLLAISKVQHRMTTHFLFIVSLALSDITIGISVMLYVLNKVMSQSYIPGRGPWDARLTSRCIFVFIKYLNSTSLNISLLNLIAMATDHFIAIIKPLHYHSIVTKRRVFVLLVMLWIMSILCGFSDYFTGIIWWPRFKQQFNYCEIVWLTPYHEEYVTLTLALVCFVAMALMYGLIYRKIQNRQRPEPLPNTEPSPVNRKPLVTTLLILGSFVLCWLPMCLFQITLIMIVLYSPDTLKSLSMTSVLTHADQYLYDLLLLNCIADPIIYAVRMHEIRLGYQRLCCVLCVKNAFVRNDSRRQFSLMKGDKRQSVCVTLITQPSRTLSQSKHQESSIQ